VTQLARPEREPDGVTCMTTELIEAPRNPTELVPDVARVMLLHDPEAAPDTLNLAQEAAPPFRHHSEVRQVNGANALLSELETAGRRIPTRSRLPRRRPQLVSRPKQLAEFALEASLRRCTRSASSSTRAGSSPTS
jgi:hypothetical protein